MKFQNRKYISDQKALKSNQLDNFFIEYRDETLTRNNRNLESERHPPFVK